VSMKILISNDDGFLAPGLRTLAAYLAAVGEVTVVAPDRDRSGASNSLTLDYPLHATETENGFIRVDGTPTDCVHLALTGLLDNEPDIVVSGINAGANMGDDVLYSGTVAAAMEGRFLGLPAIAISLVGREHFESAARVAVQLVQNLRHEPISPDVILNVNVPDLPYEQLKGMEVTRLGARHKSEPVVKGHDPRGRPLYWVGPVGSEADAGPGTDFHAIREGRVSITPIHADLTRHSARDALAQWLKPLQ